MKRFLLVLMLLTGWGSFTPAQASPWPFYSFDITGCVTPSCSVAYYDNTKTSWRNILETQKSSILNDQLTMWGVHCASGTPPSDFKRCEFYSPNGSHSPFLINPKACKTTALDNWVLADPSACVAQSSFNGYHSGAIPGAECAILGKHSAPVSNAGVTIITSLDTPFGMLTAGEVANTGNTYCGKPLKPPVDCNINIPNGGVLDHGIQAPTSTSERTLDVEIACGDNPQITITDTKIKLDDDRIQSDITLTPNGATYLLKSVLTTINATAGDYLGSTVIVVAPL